MELNSNLLENFRWVEANIPLLDAIKKIPKYAKLLKCTNKRKLKGNKQVKRFHDPKPYIVQKCSCLTLASSLFLLNFDLGGMLLLLLMFFFHGVVEIKNEVTGKVFKVNGYKIKLFLESP